MIKDMTETAHPALAVDPVSGETFEYELREARASDRPCQLYSYHAPTPARTQGHHRYPVYLQNRVYGQIQNGELLWCCGTCHDNIHEWLGWLLKETREPSPHPGRLAKAEAKRTYDWYVAAMAAKP